MKNRITRRDAIRGLSTSAAAAAIAMQLAPQVLAAEEATAEAGASLKGNIRHSVSRWCFGSFKLEELCLACKAIGIESIELQGPNEWPTLKEYGLTCAMGNGARGGIANGFNRIENHAGLIEDYEKLLPRAAEAGIPNIICMSGNRKGLDDETGLKNCALGIKKLMPLCEKLKVNLVMELLNSKVNHKDYQCDYSDWGVALCEEVGSERFGLLYDIYHMQIMEGDIIRSIQNKGEHFHHYHTGGNPGRNEIDETQELYYPAIMKAIVARGYTGFVGQEFVPTPKDNEGKLQSLREAIAICDV